MTLAERELLLTLAWAVKSQMQLIAIGTPFDQTAADSAARLIDAKTEPVLVAGLTAPQPITPRARFVRVEDAPTHQVLRCDGCGYYVKKIVRIGEYFDPSFAVCATCISEAAAILGKEL